MEVGKPGLPRFRQRFGIQESNHEDFFTDRIDCYSNYQALRIETGQKNRALFTVSRGNGGHYRYLSMIIAQVGINLLHDNHMRRPKSISPRERAFHSTQIREKSVCRPKGRQPDHTVQLIAPGFRGMANAGEGMGEPNMRDRTRRLQGAIVVLPRQRSSSFVTRTPRINLLGVFVSGITCAATPRPARGRSRLSSRARRPRASVRKRRQRLSRHWSAHRPPASLSPRADALFAAPKHRSPRTR